MILSGCALFLLLTAAAARASVTVTRTSSDQPHPSTMELEVALPDSRQKLLIPLTRSTAFDNIPITVLESGVSRRFSSRQVRHPSHSHYTHADSSSVVSVRLVDGNRRMSGHVTHEGVSYSLEPDGESGHRVVRKEASPRVDELVGKRMASSRLRRVVSRRRRQSSTWPKYVVELHLLLDHTVWLAMKNIFGDERAAMTELNFYYTHILNGINVVYRNVKSFSISVQCVGILVAKTPEDSSWLPDLQNYQGVIYFDDRFVGGARIPHKIAHLADHFMAFTRRKFYSNNEGAVGLATVGDTCNDHRSFSLTRDTGLHCWMTAAHELGHNLGAEHDGDNNECLKSDSFVLAPGISSYGVLNIGNSYRFSECSERSILEYLTSLGPSNCLLMKNGYSERKLSSWNQRTGARWSLDLVCGLTIKNAKFQITDEAARNPASICAVISCRDSGKVVSPPEIRAPVGTQCGNRKSCNWEGQCAPDAAAPPANEACFWSYTGC